MTDTTQPVADNTAPITAPVEPNPSTEPQAEPQQPENPAPSEPEQPGTDPADETQPKKKGGGFQNRIDELTRKNYEERMARELAERKLAEYERQKPGSLDAEPGPEPKLEDFTTVDEFVQAHRDWAKREGFQAAKAEVAQVQRQQEVIAKLATFESRETQAKQKYPDYEQVTDALEGFVANNQVVAGFVLESENGPELAYQLGKNPAVLAELSRLAPMHAIRELAKMEARLSAAPPPKPVTQAPAPIKPVGARESVQQTLASLAETDMDAYVKRRNAHLLKR